MLPSCHENNSHENKKLKNSAGKSFGQIKIRTKRVDQQVFAHLGKHEQKSVWSRGSLTLISETDKEIHVIDNQ